MTMPNEKIVEKLNTLIAVDKDGEAGFRQAAENITAPEVKGLFMGFADERKEFIQSLQVQVVDLGGDPQTVGTIVGTLFQGWTNLQSLISSQSDKALIEEGERVEEATVRAYQDVLQQSPDMPAGPRKLIESQYDKIQENLGRIRALEMVNNATS
jgi:uncharacterized protein (TIGR02284 family)